VYKKETLVETLKKRTLLGNRGGIYRWENVITAATSGNLISKSASPYTGVFYQHRYLLLFVNGSSLDGEERLKFDMYLKEIANDSHSIFIRSLTQ
jgi:hypothetical protein